MKINIIGAGPAGLYFALLAKKSNPLHTIQVYEQNPEGATYGWGVVFSDIGLSFLQKADDDFYQKFIAHHECCDYMEIVHQGTHVQVHGNHFSRTSRIDMLRVLNEECKQVGVEIYYNSRIDDVSRLASECDLLIAADGGNSSVRTQLAEHFQPSFIRRRNKFAWYGTRQRFHPVSLIFRETQHGIFIAHSYQYSKDLSTFLIEVDPETWQRSGLHEASEEESRHFCADVFRAELGSNELLSNKSLWFDANIVSNEKWYYNNIVLLGDALRTVHFSLGSGTRMAMQDAIALNQSLESNPESIQSALSAFQLARTAASSNFQQSASLSLDWYENVERKMHLDPITFAYDYMRRTGRVSHEDLSLRDPLFTAAYESLHGKP